MRRLVIFFFILLNFSCIDPIDLRLSSDSETLVLEGLITDAAGPYTVMLSSSLPFDNTKALPAYFKPKSGAQVSIHDNMGNETALTETKPGVYQSAPDFIGKAGFTYHISINLADGRHYRSSPELLTAAPRLDSVRYDYVVYQRLIKNSQGSFVETTSTGFKLAGTWEDPPVVNNFYRWELEGIFEFFSITDAPAIKQCWAPLDRLETTVLLSRDEFYNGKVNTMDLAIIPYDRPTQFLATVTQYSLSESAYNFWNAYRAQQLSTGSIFDPAPAPIVGNLINVNDAKEQVLGFFGASGVFTKQVLINRWFASGNVSPTPYKEPVPGDCRLHEPNATNIKPPGFK